MMNPELAENNEELAAVVEQYVNQFERSYDLKERPDQATLAEALHVLGLHLAMNSKSATLEIGVGPNGITRLTVTAKPR